MDEFNHKLDTVEETVSELQKKLLRRQYRKAKTKNRKERFRDREEKMKSSNFQNSRRRRKEKGHIKEIKRERDQNQGIYTERMDENFPELRKKHQSTGSGRLINPKQVKYKQIQLRDIIMNQSLDESNEGKEKILKAVERRGISLKD